MLSKLLRTLFAAALVAGLVVARLRWRGKGPALQAAAESIEPIRSAPSDNGAQDLNESTRAQLYEEAKRRGIAGRSRMTKAELQVALSEGTPER